MSRKIKYCVEIVRNDFNKSKYSIIYRINLIIITNTIIKYINFDKKMTNHQTNNLKNK